MQSVKVVNGKRLQALEEAMNTLLAHPLFDAVQAMAPQAICGTASKEEAGSQAAGGDDPFTVFRYYIYIYISLYIVDGTRA